MTWALAWKTRFRALPLDVWQTWSFTIPPATFDHRRMGLASLESSDAFERLFVGTLPHHFPMLYLEGYAQARDEVIRRYARVPAVLVSANAWWFNEPFRFVAAEAVEHGSRLIAVQHGGGYGIFRAAPPERHECRIADTFVTWGWGDEGDRRYRNLPHPALSSWLRDSPYGREGRSHRHGSILFVATGHPRYLYRFHSTPVGSQWAEYLDWQLRFLSTLPESLRRHLVFRPYRYDYGHAVRQRINECFAPIRWEATRPFARLLRQARIVVIDHCMTTCLEALVANVPTVLFWDPHRWELRAAAESWFEHLRHVGILWDSPEGAAGKAAQIYHEPTVWWESHAVQEARRSVVQRYALARPDWRECWARALTDIAEVG
jgi:putative transferase (TIGR04331 family)